MNLVRTLSMALCLAIASPAWAQSTPETITDSALQGLKESDAKKVIEDLLAQAPLIAIGPAEKTNLINTLNTFLSSYGEVEGWELIRSREASDRYAEHIYIVFQEKYALNWKLQFYRKAEGWTITAFSFDDKLSTVLDAQWEKKLERALAF